MSSQDAPYDPYIPSGQAGQQQLLARLPVLFAFAGNGHEESGRLKSDENSERDSQFRQRHGFMPIADSEPPP